MRHLVVVLVVGLASAGPASAQIKFADLPAPKADASAKGIVFQPVKDKADLKHGALVTVEMKNGSKMTGHVVRIDANPKANQLFA